METAVSRIRCKNTKACKFCAFITPELKLLQDHYTKEHSNEQADESLAPIPSHKRPVFCRYCYKQFADKSQSFTHEVSHIQKHLQSTSEDIISTCFICYAEGNTSLMEHLSLHNPYAKDKKSSVEEENQTSKMTTNSKRDKSRYPCTVEGCLRSYKTKGDLKIHLASHSGNKKFPCPQCEKRFPTKKQLSAHSLTHSSHTPYSCDYCNYKCKTRCHLQRHMRIHAGSKPYSCPYCQYSSTTIGI
ncbi:hypothetical protein EB796_021890 [Bugula neritina]|uniref:C2H2-type domain-containing protein n=1 Tax=Bugula neritina TaxID=10212 RepID=A0A7J7J0V1_BUGNE|nr:hypothetical protein EB796_021890 [Bugula neritina]